MAQNSIEIFDDTVLKLTVNQGTENERAVKTAGNFTMGELAFVRDTGRLFVGDCSDDETLPTTLPETGELNYTKGGILAGNRYLGMVDSKPLADTGANNGKSLNYDEITNVNTTKSSGVYVEKPILGGTGDSAHEIPYADAKFKNKMIIDGETEPVEAYKWDRKANYNEQFDAYNGDIAYDVYNNAIILFDKNISTRVDKQGTILNPVDGTPWTKNGEQIFHDENGNEITALTDKINVKRRTPIIELPETGSNSSNTDSSKHNSVYGEGYVIFRNIEPDNQTLEFVKKSFTPDGIPAETEDGFCAGYSHNVLTIKNVPPGKNGIILDPNQFNKSLYDESGNAHIKENLSWANEIGTNNNSLTVPKKIIIKQPINQNDYYLENVVIDPMTVISDFNILDTRMLAITKNNTNTFTLSAKEPFKYTIKLGDGLISGENTKSIELTTKSIPEIRLESSSSRKGGYIDPYYVYDSVIPYTDNTKPSYVNNFALSGGTISLVDTYDSSYKEDAIDWIEKYQSNGNISVNYLKKPLALVWTPATGTATINAAFEFYNGNCLYLGRNSGNSNIITLNLPRTTEPDILDIENASTSGTKNAYRYFTAEIDDSETTKKIKIGLNSTKLFAWKKITDEDGTITVIPEEFAVSGVETEVDEIKINNKVLWHQNAQGSDYAEFDIVSETDAETGTITYSLYCGCAAMLGGIYNRISYTVKIGQKSFEETINLIKNGTVTFIKSVNLHTTDDKKYIGNGDEYQVKSTYYCDNLQTGELTSFNPSTDSDIFSHKSVVFEIYLEDEEEPDKVFYIFYNTVNCAVKYNKVDIDTAGDNAIRIPAHAKQALLEISVYNSSSAEEIGVFSANSYDNLSTESAIEPPYSYSNNILTINKGGLYADENEIELLTTKSNRQTIIASVPIYRDEYSDKPAFAFRIANVKKGSYFIVKLVGYSM